MSSPPPKPPPSPLAASWLNRLHFLQSLRHQCASAPQHFRWLIQTRILQFLLKRYGSDPNLSELTPSAHPEEPLFHPLDSTSNPPRSPYVMHYYLDRISQANTDLHSTRQQKITESQMRRLNRLDKFILFLNKPLFQKTPIHDDSLNHAKGGVTECAKR